MANFNAGAIEGTLTLDRSPFNKDLKEAMAEAKKFEQSKIKVPLEIVGMEKIDELKAELDSLRDETVNIDLEVDGEDHIGELEERLNAIRDEIVTIEVEVDADAQIAELEAKLDAIPDEKVTVEVDTDDGVSALKRLAGERNNIQGTTVLVGALLAILPAVVPLALSAAAAVGALVSATAILGAGIGAFALVAIPAWKDYTKAVKAAKGDMSKLPPEMQKLKAAQDALNAAFDNAASRDSVYAVIAAGMRLTATVVGQLRPLIDAVSTSLLGVIGQMQAFAASPAFKQVVAFLAANFPPIFKIVTSIIGNLIKTIAGITEAFAPFAREFLGGLNNITAAWANWAGSLSSSQKFQDFLTYVRDTGPKIISLFMAISGAIGNIGKALAPLGGPVLDTLIGFFNAIGTMNTSVLGAIVVGLSAIVVLVIAATVAMAAFDAVAALNPFVLIAVAIIALVAAFIYLWKTNEGFRNFFISTWNAIWGFMKAVGAWFAGPFASFFVAGFNAVMAAVRFVWNIMVTVWTAIQTAITAVANAISAVIMAVFNGIKGFIVGWVNTIRAVWQAFWSVFGGVITAALNLIKALVILQFTIVKTYISGVLTAIRIIATTVWAAIVSRVKDAMNNIKAIVSTVWNAIKSDVSSKVNLIKSVVTAGWNAIKGPVTSALNAIKGAVSSGWNAVKSATSSAWDAVSKAVSSKIDEVKGKVAAVVGQIKGIFSGAAGWLYNAGVNIIQGLLAGIESMINSVTSKLKSLTNLIPKVKGPEEKDKKLLRPAGQMIMGGFIDELTKGIDQALGVLGDFSGTIPNAFEVQQALSLQPTTGPAAFPTPAPGMTKNDFVELVSQLITEIRNNTQPLIGNYNDAHQDPREIAEEWWFVTKGR